MTLTQLSYIVAVEKFKNFGQAAESCRVTQPTLSMQIQKLEEQIGVQIFDRSQQPVRTTKIGELLVHQARVILNESQRFSDIINDDKGEVKGEVTIGVIPTLAPYLIPLFLKKFSQKFPSLTIQIEELQTEHILERFKNNTIDVGLLVTPLEMENMVTSPIFYEPFLVYTSDKNSLIHKAKVTQSDLNVQDLWMLTEGHCFRDQTLAVCKSKKKTSDEKRNIKFESGSLETLKKMVDQENGFTLLPFLAAQDVAQTKKIKEFVSPVPTREVSLIHSVYYKRDALKNELIQIIQKNLPKEIPQTQNKNTQIVELPIGKI